MKVTGCDDCPLYDNDTSGCNHPDDVENWTPFRIDNLGRTITPDWCPLRKGPLTVALEGVPCPRGPHGMLNRRDGNGYQEMYCELCAPEEPE